MKTSNFQPGIREWQVRGPTKPDSAVITSATHNTTLQLAFDNGFQLIKAIATNVSNIVSCGHIIFDIIDYLYLMILIMVNHFSLAIHEPVCR